MLDFYLFPLLAFAMASSLLLLVYLMMNGEPTQLDKRLHGLTGRDKENNAGGPTVREFARTSLPKLGSALLPTKQEDRTQLQSRLLHAGLYGRQAMLIFLGVKLVMIVAPAFLGFLLGAAGLLPLREALIGGAVLGIFGLIGPGFWLDWRKGDRQTAIRRSLPDAMDVMVICLEGGLSLPGSMKRVAGELRTAHPLLASELAIVEREIELGMSAGEALRHFADRADLEEIRGLASVVAQTERFGASLVRALRIHADSLRTKRIQYAEEMAQKAAVKILFPTVVCIFPGLFIVLLAPAVMQIIAALANIK